MYKILIVDDEEPVLRALNRLFARRYDLTLYSDPLKAVESFEHCHYDLILSDIKMPHLDGFTVLKEFAAYFPNSGRMLISGYTDIDECRDALRNDIAHIIVSKPWDNFELESVVALLLENCALKNELNELKANVVAK
ncbi:response regulator [Pseudoalteromonas sp. S16_S37]|uniref:response regulator n=1 Tax=Pseudoalteromonas sp. S16_S37 TaxID=2720228 RepID=UPI0016802118|nr:response regulator [Pseudoalteromonas sp. S16_S37]MBD1582142.1 response regulator [Pseudoalteromonas sp. S16_S37]